MHQISSVIQMKYFTLHWEYQFLFFTIKIYNKPSGKVRESLLQKKTTVKIKLTKKNVDYLEIAIKINEFFTLSFYKQLYSINFLINLKLTCF